MKTYYHVPKEEYEAHPELYEKRRGVCPWCDLEFEVVDRPDINWDLVMRACYMCKG